MSTILEEAFVGNPFANPAYTWERKVLFGLDQATRLDILDPRAFAQQISATRAICARQREVLFSLSAERPGSAALKSNAREAEAALNRQLWLNAIRVIEVYADDEEMRQAAADYTLLLGEEPIEDRADTYTGLVMAGAVFNLGHLPMTPTTPLLICNPGRTPLRFALCMTESDFPTWLAVDVEPGESLVLNAGDLGDPGRKPFLNVQNATKRVGKYEVTIG